MAHPGGNWQSICHRVLFATGDFTLAKPVTALQTRSDEKSADAEGKTKKGQSESYVIFIFV